MSSRTARSSTSPRHSRPRAARPTSQCSFLRQSCKKQGYKVWTVGDDIAWIRIGEDGRLYAVNPENGFFGVAPGTNEHSNPNALATTKRDCIFTNVCHNLDNNTVWWEGLDNNPPHNAINWKGEKWDYTKYDKNDKINTSGAHPNSRFTAKATNCPCLSSEFNIPQGCSALRYHLRRPPRQDRSAGLSSPATGSTALFVGSIMASETTAAAAGAVGVVRRDPMAMRPFVGYNMGDYFQHWLDMGKKMPERSEDLPRQLVPNRRLKATSSGRASATTSASLLWILDRCEGKVDAVETPIGYVPKPEDINIEGLDGVTIDTIKDLLSIDTQSWLDDVKNIEDFYAQVGSHVPHELYEELGELKGRLLASK